MTVDASQLSADTAADTANKPVEKVGALDKFKLARGFIEHENILIGQRITWFLTLQGLLFTAFFLAVQLPWEKASDCYRGLSLVAIVGTFCIGALGIASSYVVWAIMRIALLEIRRVASWWKRQGHEGLPLRISGRGGSVNAHNFAWVFAIVWSVLLVAFWYSMRREFEPTWQWAMKDGVQLIAACKAKETAMNEPKK